MSGPPYLPPGQSSLPAERFILFADTSHQVMQIDESVGTKNGVAFTGEWQSPTLNRDGYHKYSIIRLGLLYAVSQVMNISVSASANGGATWSADVTVALAISSGLSTAYADFTAFGSGEGITGFDLRIRIRMADNVPVNIYGYKPFLVKRSEYNV